MLSIVGPNSVGPDLGPNCLQRLSADTNICIVTGPNERLNLSLIIRVKQRLFGRRKQKQTTFVHVGCSPGPVYSCMGING